jgi:S1-C subfamily serine protease
LQGSPLEHARNATVSIETPWGVGSGFFVKENYVVTNKHVVEIDKKELAEFSNKVKTGRELIRLEQEKIKDMSQQKDRLPDGPSKRQLDILINNSEEQLAKNLPQFEQAEDRLKKMARELQPGDIKIIMADGSETTANSLNISQDQDLALISLYSSVKSFIASPAQNMAMQQGDKVYTIGSPVGLRHTITSGIFSGYRKREPDGAIFLQTDAAINPGNSGGPLIDEKGIVHGVNTMIIKDTEGIGFAIPIETVYAEFHLAK